MSKDTIKLCVHVRWGDIYDRETGGGHKGFEKWHPTMSLNYYDNAISFVLKPNFSPWAIASSVVPVFEQLFLKLTNSSSFS